CRPPPGSRREIVEHGNGRFRRQPRIDGEAPGVYPTGIGPRVGQIFDRSEGAQLLGQMRRLMSDSTPVRRSGPDDRYSHHSPFTILNSQFWTLTPWIPRSAQDSSCPPKPHPFQILPFGAVERDRMIRSGAASPKQREADARIEARREDDLLEEIGAHEAGAGARQQEAAGCDEGHPETVDVLVAPRGSFDVRSLLRGGRRIAHHDVPLLSPLAPPAQVLQNL